MTFFNSSVCERITNGLTHLYQSPIVASRSLCFSQTMFAPFVCARGRKSEDASKASPKRCCHDSFRKTKFYPIIVVLRSSSLSAMSTSCSCGGAERRDAALVRRTTAPVLYLFRPLICMYQCCCCTRKGDAHVKKEKLHGCFENRLVKCVCQVQ
jgi:hypothetical protein